jgi:hypothetical protein
MLDKQRYTLEHKYVILIAFPLQQWFRQRAPVFRYTYIACLVFFNVLILFHTHLEFQNGHYSSGVSNARVRFIAAMRATCPFCLIARNV